MDRITAAEVFVETVARGSISAAANHLEMSRAMATRYVAQMEAWADGRLLHRTTRRLSLTAAGEDVLLAARELLTVARSVKGLGSDEGAVLKGQLRVSCASIFAEHCLTDALTEFMMLHPEVGIDLHIADRITNLAEEGVDLAIRVTNDLDPNVVARRLGDVHSVICASPAYIAQRGLPGHARDLSAHNCLAYANLGRSAWAFEHRSEKIEVAVSGNFSSNDASVVARAALHGAGIAVLPRFAAAKAINEGRLIPMLEDFRVQPLGVYAVYLSRSRMPKSLRALIDHLAVSVRLLASA